MKFKEIFFSVYGLPSKWGRISSLKLFIFLLAVFLVVPWTSAQDKKEARNSPEGKAPLRVAILPVDIHSPENIGYIQQGLVDMLASRVELQGRVEVLEKSAVKKALAEYSGEMDSQRARKIGQALEADYVVYGSLTKLGDSASLDLKVTSVKEEKPSSSVFAQSKKMEEIIARVDDLARMIDEKVLGYPISPVAQQPALAQTPPAAPGPMAAVPVSPPGPQSAFPAPQGAIVTPSPSAYPAAPPGFRPMTPGKPERGAVIPPGFWQSTPFPFKVVGISVADFDGDGKNEIAMIDERNLWIYRWENEFKLVKKITGKNTDQYLAIDAGDVQKEGKARIFITNLEGDQSAYSDRTLSSYAVSYVDGDYRVVASNIDWYLRVVQWGEKGPVLLGQKRGLKTPYDGPLYELGWNGKGYKDTRKIDVNKVFSLYGFTPFVDGGKMFYAYIDSDSRLKVLDSKGKQIWRSNTNYGSDNAFRVQPMPSGVGYYEGDDLSYVNVRVVAQGNELIVLRNISPVGQLFKRQQYFTGGEVQALSWNGAMFMETWRSQEIPGYLADFQIENLDNTSGKELIVAVNLPKEGILSGQASSALMVSRMQ